MFFTAKHLQRWLDADLISVEQLQAIHDFEKEQSSSRSNWVIWGISAIGVAAIAIGIISLVAANWDKIPPNLKLVSYLFWQSIAGGALYYFLPKSGIIRETLIALFTLMFFAGIGLTAQVFNIKSDGWSGLLMWCGLALPMVLCARARPISYIWVIVLAIAESIFLVVHVEKMSDQLRQANWIFAGALSVYLYFALGIIRRGKWQVPEGLAEAMRTMSFLGIFIFGTIVGSVMWYDNMASAMSNEIPEILWRAKLLPWVGAIIASAALWWRSPRYDKRLTIALMSAFLAMAAFTTFPMIFATDKQKVLGTIFSIGVWWILAMAAVYDNKKWIFDTITLLITVRILVVYFEVFGSMMATGIGLIISGVLILGGAWFWYKFRSRLAGWVEDT